MGYRRHSDRLLVSIVLAIVVDTFGTGVFVPVSLLFFTRVAGMSLSQVGVITSVAAATSLVVPVLVGRLADRFRPRSFVVTGQVLQACGFLGYLVARAPAAVFVVIALVAVGQRVFWSSFFTLVAALPVDGTDERVRDRRYAIVGMAQSAGFGVGALVAGALLVSPTDRAYLTLAALNAATFAASALLLIRVPQESPTTAGAQDEPDGGTIRSGYRQLFRDRVYLGYTVANVAFCICSVALGAGLPVYIIDGVHGPAWVVGPVLAANTVLLSLGQLAATRLIRPLSRTQALMLAGALWALWAFLTAAAPVIDKTWVGGYLVAVVLLYAVAELIHAPTSNALAAEAAPERARGTYLAIFQYGFTVATMVVPLGFTTLFSVGPAVPWLGLGGLVAAGTVAIRLVSRPLTLRSSPLSARPVTY
jgi:MFS family permease